MTYTSTSSSPAGQVGTTSSCMDDSGGPWRSLRIAQACILAGTWPSGGTSPMPQRSFGPPAAGGLSWVTDAMVVLPAGGRVGYRGQRSVTQNMLQCNNPVTALKV